MAWSEKFLADLRRRIVQAKSHEEDDTPLRATCATLFLGWIHTSRRYGSGFIDQDGNMRTWRDIPSFDECEKLIDAAAAVDGDPVDVRTVIAYESGFEAGKDAAAKLFGGRAGHGSRSVILAGFRRLK